VEILMTKPVKKAADLAAAEAPTPDNTAAPFDPVPVAPRHDGWTAERQRRFISALADTGCVSDACQAVGVNARSAYRLRRRPGAEAFDAAWRDALLVAAHRLTTIAFERAVYGSTRQVWRDGELVLEERKVSDRLLIFLLTHYDSMRYGDLGRLTDVVVRDPRERAREALPQTLAALTDCDEPAEPLGPADFAITEREPFDG
jgi:hypothetical protein